MTSVTDKKANLRPPFVPAALLLIPVFLLLFFIAGDENAKAGFNASCIISDYTLTQTSSMSQADIQAFLESKGSYLAHYSEARDSYIGPNNDVAARGWSASRIIWQVANWYGVNPEVILATLQKEQSLVTNPSPPQWALDWAMGYGCPDSSPCASYPGFALQVDWGTWQLRWNMDLANGHDQRVSPYITGNTVSIDSTPVYLSNGATASLYRYTPHFHGNQNFILIFENWFGSPMFHPFGSLDSVQGTEGQIRIGGWAIDPDTTSPIGIHIYVDGQPVEALTANQDRPDVGAAYPAYGSLHGFSKSVAAAAGRHTACAYGINVGYGGNALIGCKTVDVLENSSFRSPIGSVDSVQGTDFGFKISGWAIDPDTSNPIDVHVYADGQPVAAFTAGQDRPDVGAAYPNYGGLHGFSRTIISTGGTHTVCAYGINNGPGGNALLGCKTAEVPRNPAGTLDSVEGVALGLKVGGWAIDPDTSEPIDVHIYVDGQPVTATTADRERPDVGAAFPIFGSRHGYSKTIVATGGSHTVCAYGINTGPGGNALLECKTADVPSSPSGNVDSVNGVPFGLRASGWAIDPDTSEPIDVHIYVDGQPVTATTADRDRPDVGAAFPIFGNPHGFDKAIPLAAGNHTLCIYGINVGNGGNNLLGCKTAAVPGSPAGNNPFGYMDSIQAVPEGVRVSGWAIDPNTINPIDVHVYMDDQPVAALAADADRPDVGAAFQVFGSLHGFNGTMPAPEGSHTFCAYGINQGPGGNALLECKAINIQVNPYGSLDGVSAGDQGQIDVNGWAIDPDTTGPIDVHVYVNGQYADTLYADVNRPDVGAAYPGFGSNHGFNGSVPGGPGSTVCAYGINAGPGGNALLGCKVLQHSASATIKADSAFTVTDGNGSTLATLTAGQVATVGYSSGTYSVQAPGVNNFSSSHIVLSPVDANGIMQVTSYHDIPSWDTRIDDNRFRGNIEVRYSPVTERVWVINELPLEHYLRGIAETSSGAPQEYLKTMSIAARDYALFHVNRGGKYYPEGQDIFHLKNSRHGNGDDQVYRGYGLEARFPDLTAAVVSTNGLVVTYGGSLALATYFSNTDGRTRSAEEAWGITYWPWLTSVLDPDCNGMSLNGHGVGLSAYGAYQRALRGETHNDILSYYYQGTVVQPMATDKNIRVAIYSPS